MSEIWNETPIKLKYITQMHFVLNAQLYLTLNMLEEDLLLELGHDNGGILESRN